MGCSGSKKGRSADYILHVKTGDVKGASTNANVFGRLHNEKGEKSPEMKLDVWWKNDFEQGQTDLYYMNNLKEFGDIHKIEFWRDGSKSSDDWFVEKAIVEKCADGKQFIFPVNRWIQADMPVVLQEFDSCLPQEDEDKERRQKELDFKRNKYEYTRKVAGSLAQIKECPDDETFSNDYKWDLAKNKATLMLKAKVQNFTTPKFKTLKDMEEMYNDTFPVPYGLNNWKSDVEFGYQRLSGCNATTIRLCTAIPANFPVTAEMVEPFLEDQKLDDLIARKKIYIMDYKVLENLPCSEDRKLCSPLALFYSNKNGDPMPIAIQLEQEPSEDNPIFVPSDPEYTWMLAKMFFNNADAQWHQAAVHLGLTHLVIESFAVCTHRQLSPSHPLFRLMAPHFLFLIAINSRALEVLVSEGGWVDKTMTMGRIGLFGIVKRVWSEWRLDIQGSLPNDLKDRGVEDVEALPNYHYRDDALLTYDAIKKHVTAVVNGFYDTPEKIANDTEIQAWAEELTKTESEGGCHVKGMASKFNTAEEISEVCTSIIYISSVGHGAANFAQYDEYAFPPNYPSILYGDRPKDKAPKTEEDIVELLPSKKQFLDVMIVTKILSDRGTNALGDFEVEYAYDPISMKASKEFRKELKAACEIIDERNKTRFEKYIYLSPAEVPNAISI